MKLVYAGAAAIAVMTGIAAMSAPPSIDPFVVSAIAASSTDSEQFTLLAGGSDGGCRVTVQSAAKQGGALLLAPACSTLVPALSNATSWLERPDGSIVFMSADERVLAEFAAADGAALESYRPLDPVITLLAL